MNTYEPIITPIPDTSMWVHTEFDRIMPPALRRPPGRPKKARRKGQDEAQNQVRKHYRSLRCTKCGIHGHNSRTCKGPVRAKNTRKRQSSETVQVVT